MKYIKGKGVFVGEFSDEDISKGIDKIAVKAVSEATGLEYVNTEFSMKGSEIVGLKLWCCTLADLVI